MNFSENEQLKINKYKNLKTKENKFIIYILFSLFFLISLFIIIYIIKINHKNNIMIKEQLIEKLNLIEKNLKNIKESTLQYKGNNNIYNILCPMSVVGHKKIRIGKKADGGYILLDDLKNIKIAYSFGISREISFDKELADKKIDVYMYDHTIKSLPFENSRFHWKKIGLSGIISNKTNLKTLPELLKENGHSKENDIILKIDIESHEWEVFQNLPTNILNKFKYIVGEFHISKRKKFNYYNILEKLELTHQIFHLHCNNCSNEIIYFEGYYICPFLEISFIQKEGYNFSKFNSSFPINGLDYKNCANNEQLDELLNIFI
jgi:hypothetical protein